jgi:hypothetical protein
LERVLQKASIEYDLFEASLTVVPLIVFLVHIVISAFRQISYEVWDSTEDNDDE